MDSLRRAPRWSVSRLLTLLTQLALAAAVIFLATLAFTSGPEPPPDLDIDSDNNNGTGWPDRSAYEESIEEVSGDPQYPGKLVAVNDNDDDGDGVPDFADGYDLDGQPYTGDDYNMSEGDFAPVVLELPYPINICTTWVWVSYDCSPPLSVGYWGSPPAYYPPVGYGGTLRLWKPYPGNPLLPQYDRNPANAGGYGGGDFVGPGWYQAWELGFSDYSRTITLHVEAVAPSLQLGDEPIYVYVYPNGAGQYPYYVECVRVSCVRVDLDVDSDNTNGFDAPARTDSEDQIEGATGDDARPGKVVLVDSDDSDRDGIPDFADGFDYLDGVEADNASEGSRFVPIVLEVPEPIALANAEVELAYSASDPAGVAPTLDDPYWLPPGHLRLWKKDGSVARDKRGVAAGGDYVAPGTRYSPAQLGFQARTLTLYLEAVRESAATADLPITLRVYPLGAAAPAAPRCEDTVRVTATRIQVLLETATTGEQVESQVFVATRFPEEGAAENGWDSAPGAVATYRIRVYDPRQGITTVRLDGQDVPVQRNGAAYESAPFVGILPEDQHLLDEDEPFVLSLDELTEREYNADVLPDHEAADPAPWTVSSAGEPPVSVADGVLDIDTTVGEAAYFAQLSGPAHWRPAAALSVVNIRFLILAHGEAGGDGAFALRIGDDANHWFVGLRPDRIVHYPGGTRAEIALPPQIGQGGCLLDGQFHTLTLSRAAGGTTAQASIDLDQNGVTFELDGAGSPADGLLWGDTGEGVSGRVLYDYLHWWHETTGETIYQTSPSQMVAGNSVYHFPNPEVGLSYNPEALPRPRVRTLVPTDLDEKMRRVTDLVVDELKANEWWPEDETDTGEYGKTVHARVSDKLRGKKRWLVDAFVDKNTRQIVSIGQGQSTDAVVQVDAIGLQKGYRPKVGDILDLDKARVYELKASLTGTISQAQRQRLLAVTGGRPFAQVRAKMVWTRNGFVTAKNVSRTLKILQLIGLAATAWAVIHYDHYEDQFRDMASAWVEFRRCRDEQADPAETMACGLRAVLKTKEYLSNFLPDDTALNLVALHECYRIIGTDW